MAPKGFKFSVAQAAIKYKGRTDMALIYSERECSAAAMFTTNKVKAAPIWLGMKNIRSGKARAVVVNAGNANACTGWQGMRDAGEMSRLVSEGLGIPALQVFPSSTGVIGVPMPMRKVARGIEELTSSLGGAKLKDVARAIMTTDTFPKLAERKVKLGQKEGVIAGVAKGAGMIAPNMATLLCFIVTDIAVEPRALKAALRDAVEHSFNRITIDGDRSTNDTALIMANGAIGNKPITEGSGTYKAFASALKEVTYELSKMIATDGEGATKLIEVTVKGARSEAEAKHGALKIANSMLVKTAIYGQDPNWGRIMSSLGSSGIEIKEEMTDVFLGGVGVFLRGTAAGAEEEARRKLKKKEVNITVDLRLGKGKATVLTCDLTEGYIKENAEYTS